MIDQYKLVPVEPTPEMLKASDYMIDCDPIWMARAYRAMLAAAPEAPQPVKRQPLTDEEIDRVTDVQWASNNHKPIYAAHRAYARAVIAAYERKNGIGGQP